MGLKKQVFVLLSVQLYQLTHTTYYEVDTAMILADLHVNYKFASTFHTRN